MFGMISGVPCTPRSKEVLGVPAMRLSPLTSFASTASTFGKELLPNFLIHYAETVFHSL